MKYIFDENNWIIRFDQGDRLSEALKKFSEETGCEGGWISGIGGVQEIILGHYSAQDKAHRWRTFTGFYEVTSLQGTLTRAQEGKPLFHLHATMGDEQFRTYGGHVQDMVVGITFELFIHSSKRPLQRRPEPQFDIQVLDVA